MVISNNAKNRIRDLLADDIVSTSTGTDGTAPTAGDTGLGSLIVGSPKTPSITTSNKTINVSTTWLSTETNGNTIKESAVLIDLNTLLDRFVFPDFDKTTSNELTIIDVIKIL